MRARWSVLDSMGGSLVGRRMLRVCLGLLLFVVAAIIGLSHASPASAQTAQSYLPDGASVKPGGLWDPPANGNYFEQDQWGRITGAYGCVSFSQLPPSANTICGYIDIWPQPAPPNVPPPTGQRWVCYPGINILPYSVPFNKGACGFFSTSSPPQNAFVPTAEQTAAAQEFLKPFRSDGDKDNVQDIRDNCAAKANPDQFDVSGDGVGDACDPSPLNDEQLELYRSMIPSAELAAKNGQRIQSLARLIRETESRKRKAELRKKQLVVAGQTEDEAIDKIIRKTVDQLWKSLNLPVSKGTAGAQLRKGQLLEMWGFVSDLKKLSNYSNVVVQKADAYYQTSEGRFRLDLRAQTSQLGQSYAELSAADKEVIARQAQQETGAYKVLLQGASQAGKSGAEVTFGKHF